MRELRQKNGKRVLGTGLSMIVLFGVWSLLIQIVDVKPAGATGTNVGFATLNSWFHQLTGVHMWLYTITDWLGLIPVLICLIFGMFGFVQMIKRKSMRKVDFDLRILGIYYVTVILGCLVFEMFPVNFRPILIEGRMEASYPSSTTLLVLSVMPTLVYQTQVRLKNSKIKKVITLLSIIFTGFMIIGRIIAGVHWITDIAGAVLLSTGLFCLYMAGILLYNEKQQKTGGRTDGIS